MLLSLLYSLLRLVLDALILHRETDATLRVEVLALHHQLRVLERRVRRPRFQPADRVVLAALSRILPRPAWRSFLVSPETLVGWHRELVVGSGRSTLDGAGAADLARTPNVRS